MNFELEPLPYAYDALEPHISATTLELHYDKHHRGYLGKLEKAIAGTPQASQSISSVVRDSRGDTYNNAAQVWNHACYWHSMTPPDEATEPDKSLHEAIKRDFGSTESLLEEFADTANSEFGSGWAWLVASSADRLRVISTSDAECPISNGERPLLALDVWEHAYYLDYRNERGAYVDAFLRNLVNWAFANANFRRSA